MSAEPPSARSAEVGNDRITTWLWPQPRHVGDSCFVGGAAAEGWATVSRLQKEKCHRRAVSEPGPEGFQEVKMERKPSRHKELTEGRPKGLQRTQALQLQHTGGEWGTQLLQVGNGGS